VHIAQVPPVIPHAPVVLPVWQAPPWQQPVGHEVASQTQVPLALLQSRPDPHAEHAAPAVPHEPLDSDAHSSHVPVGPPLQQPFGHDAASHTHCPLPVLHASPAAHALQVVPPAPHDELDSLPSGSHAPPPVQQPAHDEPPHVHTPPEQL
jgi:hypothetical protein